MSGIAPKGDDMTHKQLAMKYFKELQFKVNGYSTSNEERKVEEMFRHLFEAIKVEISQDMAVCSDELLNDANIVHKRR